MIEMLIVVALICGVAATSAPLTASVIDAGRVRQAAGFAAARMRLARHEAVGRGASIGLVFDRVGGRWSFRVCSDGNQNGLRRAELAGGPDTCFDGPFDVEAMFGGAAVAVDPALRGPDGEAGSPDAVRFGRSDILTFSPSGTSSSGSLLLRSPLGTQFIVRVAGATGRTRILRYDPAGRAWRDW